jgi:hypothetical protein
MNNPAKNELLERLMKALRTDTDLAFLLSLDQRDLKTLLITVVERIEQLKQPMTLFQMMD